jgi:hypothetical protein
LVTDADGNSCYFSQFVLAVNCFWENVSSFIKNNSRLFSASPVEHATIRYIHYGALTMVLVSIGLMNISIGLYIGAYLLLSHLISNSMWVHFCWKKLTEHFRKWNNIVTRSLYGVLMSPLVFYLITMILASEFGCWSVALGNRAFSSCLSCMYLDLQDPEKIAIVLLKEARRYLKIHLQHNSINLFIFMLVLQPTHSVFISLIGGK